MKNSGTDAQNSPPKNKNILLMTAVMWILETLYLASPIDLIPDLIPILGQLDDALSLLVVVGLTVFAVQRMRRKHTSDDPDAPDVLPARATVIDASVVEEPLTVSPTLED
jgi:uncharacterized membrane protein YkvA (DUF1232 family)